MEESSNFVLQISTQAIVDYLPSFLIKVHGPARVEDVAQFLNSLVQSCLAQASLFVVNLVDKCPSRGEARKSSSWLYQSGF